MPRSARFFALALLGCLLVPGPTLEATETELPAQRIGYTELRTNLPGGRHANVRTQRAVVMKSNGSGRKLIAETLVDDPDAWTQFAGWSPDGIRAIVARGWQDPQNAAWEEEHQSFRMLPGHWQLDSCLVELATGKVVNVTATERVSHYNGGLFFLPEGRGLGFTALINGISKPFIMDLDGRDKRDVSGQGNGFAYGYSASPDGRAISYHEDYQVYIADTDGSHKRLIETGNPFNFAPKWSPDGQWLLFVSGVHGRSNLYLVRRDGTDLQKRADFGGYQGWILFLDVPDFHQGSSDLPAWSTDSQSVYYTATVDESVELFQVTLGGQVTRLTHSPPGTLHYHPTPSPDGHWLLYGSKRAGVRQLFARDLQQGNEIQLTHLPAGHAAMWPHWQPGTGPGASQAIETSTQVILCGEAASEQAPHGLGNVYAPDVHRQGNRWLMWYGGQGKDGHDRIHFAESQDGVSWRKHGVVLDRGSANHVNDPAVVRVDGQWWMFYTVAQTAELDEIAAATSLDGLRWEKRGVVVPRGPADAWDSWKVGRPAVLHDGHVFRMWFDGQPTAEAAAVEPLAAAVKREGRAVGYAESPDGLVWSRHPKPVYHEGAGAVHVGRDGQRLVMVIESHQGVRWAESRDGFSWQGQGLLLPVSGRDFDRYGHVTPFLMPTAGQAFLYLGAASRASWDGNSIARAVVVLPEPFDPAVKDR